MWGRLLKACASFPSFSPKYNTTLSHNVGKDSSLFKMQNHYKSFPTIFFYIFIFHVIFIYLYISFFSFLFFFLIFSLNILFLFFPKTWNSSPKWKNYSPAFGANNRRIDAPGGYSDPFCKNLNQRSLTPRWPLTPHLLRSHVWLYSRIVILQTEWVITVSFWTQFRRDKNVHCTCLSVFFSELASYPIINTPPYQTNK